MDLPLPFLYASALAVLSGGLILVFATFFSRPWVFADWVKVAFLMIGLSGIAWAGLKLIMLIEAHSFSRRTYLVLDHYRTLVAGVAVGLLALFFISGKAAAGLKQWRELKRTRNPKAQQSAAANAATRFVAFLYVLSDCIEASPQRRG